MRQFSEAVVTIVKIVLYFLIYLFLIFCSEKLSGTNSNDENGFVSVQETLCSMYNPAKESLLNVTELDAHVINSTHVSLVDGDDISMLHNDSGNDDDEGDSTGAGLDYDDDDDKDNEDAEENNNAEDEDEFVDENLRLGLQVTFLFRYHHDYCYSYHYHQHLDRHHLHYHHHQDHDNHYYFIHHIIINIMFFF